MLKQLDAARRRVDRWDGFRDRAAEISELLPLAGEDAGIARDLGTDLSALQLEVEQASLEAQLSGPYDERSALLAISAGVGGTDAADWAEMLVRMYLRWAERRGFRAELLESTPGE